MKEERRGEHRLRAIGASFRENDNGPTDEPVGPFAGSVSAKSRKR